MSALQLRSEHACFGGMQRYYQHDSAVIGLPMRFSVYEPPQAKKGNVPVLFFLAGLTCTEETFMMKAGAQRMAAELGLMLVTPDTSPRNTGIAGVSESWDFGHGAGFYLDATQSPWSQHFRMDSYISSELHQIIVDQFPADSHRMGIFGHSMGGHGALVLALRHPTRYRSVSAFAPISAPSLCPWGEKAFSQYLGADRASWRSYDACALIEDGHRSSAILVDQGLNDSFLTEQLHPHLLEEACTQAGQALTLRRHALYDHGYYFISSFIDDHLQHHARQLFR